MGAEITLTYSEMKTEKGNRLLGLLRLWIQVFCQDDQFMCLAWDKAAVLGQHVQPQCRLVGRSSICSEACAARTARQRGETGKHRGFTELKLIKHQ